MVLSETYTTYSTVEMPLWQSSFPPPQASHNEQDGANSSRDQIEITKTNLSCRYIKLILSTEFRSEGIVDIDFRNPY